VQSKQAVQYGEEELYKVRNSSSIFLAIDLSKSFF
jgi:hypothetical protein